MIKPVYKVFIIITVVCLAVFLTISVLSVFSEENFDEEISVNVFSEGIFDEKEAEISVKTFPLEVDLQNYVFSIGEKISFNATITNKCGKDVTVGTNGFMPCMYIHAIDDTEVSCFETTSLYFETLKANDKMSQVFEREIIEPGKYVIHVHYNLKVDGIRIKDKLADIIIELK